MQPLSVLSVYSNMTSTVNKTILIFAFAFSTIVTHAQKENETQDTPHSDATEYQSLLNPKHIRGCIGIHTGLMNVGNSSPILKSGASVAVILDQKLSLGFVGHGVAASQNITLNNEPMSMVGGYGGILIEPILRPKSPIHFSIPVSIGGGKTAFFNDPYGYRNWEYQLDRVSRYQATEFLYIEPGVSLEMNITKFMRFDINASYMLTTDINSNSIVDSQIDGLSLGATLKLGWFK